MKEILAQPPGKKPVYIFIFTKETKLVDQLKKMIDESQLSQLKLVINSKPKEQLSVYEETGKLFAKGKKYNYIINKQGFIQQIKENTIEDICVSLDNRYIYPDTDNVIAMKLMIENNEKKVLKLANNHGSNPRPKELPKSACADHLEKRR